MTTSNSSVLPRGIGTTLQLLPQDPDPMTASFRGRRAVQLENENLRLTVLVEGGHIAELLHKPSGINPLWTPPWPSIEPSTYDRSKHPEYGADSESKLLAGLMG